MVGSSDMQSGLDRKGKALFKPSYEDRILAIGDEAVAPSKVRLRVTNIKANLVSSGEADSDFNTTLYTTEAEAQRAIRENLEAGLVRIISVYSDRTIAPLSATKSLLRDIFLVYELDASFVDNVCAFGGDPRVAEANNSFFSHTMVPEEAENIAYQFRYVEENNRNGIIRWSTRHMSVYHSRRLASDVLLLLHCIPEPTVEQKLIGLAKDNADQIERLEAFAKTPSLFHEALFETYSPNWRYYLRHIGDQFNHENNEVMTILAEETNARSTFAQVQKLRNTVDKLLFAKSLCQGNLQLIRRIQQSGFAKDLKLKNEADNAKAFLESATSLQQRVQNAIDFLEDVEVNTQLKQVTEQLKALTQQTVDDSATVMIVTFLSAFFIPGSFVGTVFGMNFFSFDAEARRIVIASDFWIFILTWLPLTVLTAGICMFIIWQDGRAKGKQIKWPWTKRATKPATSTAKECGKCHAICFLDHSIRDNVKL